MPDYKPPHSNDEPEIVDPYEHQTERKIPEFVFVDQGPRDEKEKIGATPHEDPKQMFSSIQTIAKGKQPFHLRILAFLGTFVMLLGCAIILFFTLIFALFSLIFLRQSSYMNEQVSIAWRIFKKAVVFTLGCFVCVFNLSFGMGIILMYFMLSGESINQRFMQEFMRK